MKVLSLILSLTAIFAVSPSFADELTQHDLELFANARFGAADGKARYWYRTGPVRDAKTGERLRTFEYYDTVRHVIDPDNPHKHYGLVTKLDLFHDKDNAAPLTDDNGNPVKPWVFPYQLFEAEIIDGKFHLTVTQGTGKWLRSHAFTETSITRHNGYAYINILGAWSVSRPEAPAISHSTMATYFVVCETSCSPEWSPIQLQSGVGSGEGKDETFNFHVFFRYDNFEDLPERVRTVINSDFPEFREPPRDLEQIKSMQR